MDGASVVLPRQLGVVALPQPQQRGQVVLDLELRCDPPLLMEVLRLIAIELPAHIGIGL